MQFTDLTGYFRFRHDIVFQLVGLAWYYFKVGKYNEALSLLEVSLDMMPYDPTVNDHYGDVLWKLGNELEARFYWQKAIDLDQENIFEDKVKIKLLKVI